MRQTIYIYILYIYKKNNKNKNVQKYETLLTTIYVPELVTLAVALH